MYTGMIFKHTMYLTQFLIWPLFLSNVHFKNRLCDLLFNQIMTLWKLLEGWMCLDARQNPQVFNYSHLIISFIIVQMGLKEFCHRWPIHPIPVNPIISYPLGLSAHPTLILSKLINIYLWCIIFYPVQILWVLVIMIFIELVYVKKLAMRNSVMIYLPLNKFAVMGYHFC